jgi:serine protease Do
MAKTPLLLSAALLFSLTLYGSSITFNEAPTVAKRTAPMKNGDTILSYNSAVSDAISSIVHIATKQSRSQEMMQQMHPFFEQFFGPQFRPKRAPKRQSLGSGVIVGKNGYIITNSHVVDGADEIIVTIPDSEKEYDAKLIGTDPKSDIAVIKIEADDLKPILVGSSSDLRIGDVVFAIGNPFGVGQTVTQGIISAQHKQSVGINEYENFIQTDASINPGNSGGALIDSRGALIGINSAIVTRSGGNVGIGFAIEVDMAKTIARKLIEHGSVERGYLGVTIGDLTKELRNLYKNSEGAMLIEVHEDSPAAKAGLQRGDLVLKVEDKAIKNATELKNSIGFYTPGTQVKITFERDKKIKTVTVKLGNLEESALAAGSSMLDGLELMPLTDNTRYHYRIPRDVDGVVVTDVKPDSEAEAQGIREGDVIVQIEKMKITDMKTLGDALKKYKGVYKRVYISRGGRVFVVALK